MYHNLSSSFLMYCLYAFVLSYAVLCHALFTVFLNAFYCFVLKFLSSGVNYGFMFMLKSFKSVVCTVCDLCLIT